MPLNLEKIRRLREQKGMTFKAAADAAGFKSRQTWFQLETGRLKNPTLSTLESVAAVLGVHAKDLFK